MHTFSCVPIIVSLLFIFSQNTVLSVCRRGVSHLMYSFEEEDQSRRGSSFSPLQYVVSIQPGLSEWVELVIKSPDNQW